MYGEEEMTETIKRYCCVCGLLMPGQMSAYDLIQCGAGTNLSEGQLIFHCRKHSREEIVKALARDLRFHRASKEMGQ
jgi:hypothetical protein